MDFLKNCTTNHYSTKDFSTLQYAVFKQHDQVDSTASINTLRSRHILCSHHHDKVWLFGQNSINLSSAFAEDVNKYELQEQGTFRSWLESDQEKAVMALKNAIEEGLTHNLAGVEHMKKLGKWTWIIASDSEPDSSTVLQLQTVVNGLESLSFTLEALNVPVCQASYLGSKVKGSEVILSPSGVRGTIVVNDENEVEVGPFSESWKHDTLQKLMLNHHSPGQVEWLQIRVRSSKDESCVISWPLDECFIVNSAALMTEQPSELSVQTDSDALPIPDYNDGLDFAHTWMNAAVERQQKILNHGNDESKTDLEKMDTSSETDEAEVIASPVFLARPDIMQNLGMYPTPPDGMVGITYTQPPLPVETPADNAPQAEITNTEVAATDTLSMPDLDNDEQALPTFARETSMLSNPAKFQRSMTDELFGDAETGHVGDEIGDDDFDFFDTEAEIRNVQFNDSKEPVSTNPARDSETPSIAEAIEIVDEVEKMDVVDSSPEAHNITSSDEHPNIVISVSDVPAALSPLDILQRLLPPSDPASTTVQNQSSPTHRRKSNFDMLKFNDTPSSLSRLIDASNQYSQPGKSTHRSSFTRIGDDQQTLHDDNDDNSSLASSNAATAQLPPALPWSSRKRKRTTDRIADRTTWHVTQASTPRQPGSASTDHMLDDVLRSRSLDLRSIIAEKQDIATKIPTLEGLIGNHARDLITIAQLVAEQSMSCISLIGCGFPQGLSVVHSSARDVSEHTLIPALSSLLPSVQVDDISSLAIQREASQRTVVKPAVRTPLRPESMMGPDLYQLQAPFLRFRRAENLVEMLPPSIQFWETLSLAPAHDSKKIRTFFIAPDDETIRQRLADFRSDLKTTYENSRLGSFDGQSDVGDDQLRLWSAYIINSDYQATSIYEAYKDACLRLAQYLTKEATRDTGTSFVIFMIDPFPRNFARHILCACFLALYRSYLDANKAASHESVSDLCLHILPSALITSPHKYAMLSSEQLNLIAREMYDRCPPRDDIRTKSPISAYNSILLAEPLPKRINFQLTATPPSNLFHEGSELHVAYAKSKDGMWVSVAWSDNVGNQQNASFCLRGFSVFEVVSEIWNRTVRILQSRQGFWRVSIATCDSIDEDEIVEWKEIVKFHKPQQGSVNVLFVLLEEQPRLCLTPKFADIVLADDGAPTPESSSQALIVSPEASGNTAPPTPAPSDGVDGDTDAHMVDLSDETYCVLLSTDLHQATTAMASGILLKRGAISENDDTCLPSLGIEAVWFVRSKSGETDTAEISPRHVELMLKEVMTSFRSLAVLAKVRGLQRTGEEMLPIHVLGAKRGAEALISILEPSSVEYL